MKRHTKLLAIAGGSDPSKVALSGGVQFLGLDADNGDQAVAVDNGVVDSFPGRMDWDTNTPKADRLDGWIVRMNKNASGQAVSVWTVCADANN